MMAFSIISNILYWKINWWSLDLSYIACAISAAFMLIYKLRDNNQVQALEDSSTNQNLLDS